MKLIQLGSDVVQWGGGSEGSSQRVVFKLGFKAQKGGTSWDPVVKSLEFPMQGAQVHPHRGTKIPHATWHGKIIHTLTGRGEGNREGHFGQETQPEEEGAG